MIRAKLLACSLLLLIFAEPFSAQTGAPQPRKFRATYEIQMYASPDFHSEKVTKIPSGVVLEALAETKRYGGYVQVSYKNKTGWVLKAEMTRFMDKPAPELVCFSNGYKIIGSTYRYFFVLRNDGMLPYGGPVTLRLFDKDNKVVFERNVDFTSDPIQPDTAGNFNIDTEVEAPRFELEHKNGKIEGTTGKFIERL
ncbi:MAG TPA: SH3 domain-containing protein [Pyrinomonadaceae bacterium]|jgi:hypothetical protein